MSKVLSVREAIREGLAEEMRRDETVLLMGPASSLPPAVGDPDGPAPDQVFSAPLSGEALCAMAVGAALRGLRPCVELPRGTDLLGCLGALSLQAARMRCLSGGQCAVPLVLRLPHDLSGPGVPMESLEGLVCRFPGLKAAAPSCAADAKGLIRSALQDPDPVVIFEHPQLSLQTGEIPDPAGHIVPLGRASVKRQGREVSILAWSRQVTFALDAAEALSSQGIDAEVIDLRSLVPLDWEAIRESVSKTHHVLIVSEEIRRCSLAGEVSAQIAETLFDELDAPVERLSRQNVTPVFTPGDADGDIPRPADIAAAVRRLLNK